MIGRKYTVTVGMDFIPLYIGCRLYFRSEYSDCFVTGSIVYGYTRLIRDVLWYMLPKFWSKWVSLEWGPYLGKVPIYVILWKMWACYTLRNATFPNVDTRSAKFAPLKERCVVNGWRSDLVLTRIFRCAQWLRKMSRRYLACNEPYKLQLHLWTG